MPVSMCLMKMWEAIWENERYGGKAGESEKSTRPTEASGNCIPCSGTYAGTMY